MHVGLAQLESQVDALPTAEDLAAKADVDDVTSLQNQQALNTAALTALESHGTEGGTALIRIFLLNTLNVYSACTFRARSSYAGNH